METAVEKSTPAPRPSALESVLGQVAAQQSYVTRSVLESAAAKDRLQGRHDSPAAARLEVARAANLAAKREPFVPVEDGQGGVFIKRLSWPETERVRTTVALSLKTSNSVLDLRLDASALRAFTICVLEACVFSEANVAAPYFANLGEAAAWVDSFDPELQALTYAWRAESVRINPLLEPPGALIATIPEPPTPEDEEQLEALLKDVPQRPVESAPESSDAPEEASAAS